LLALLIAMFISMLVFSAIVYYMEDMCDEEDTNPQSAQLCISQKAKFRSIPSTFWWCIATMTAVGYGDMAPVTTAGKLFGAVTMLIGILVFSLPITVIGSNYEHAYHTEVMRRLVGELETGIEQIFKTTAEKRQRAGAPPDPVAMVSLIQVQELTKRWSSNWSADHTHLWERISLMWDMYDIRLDGRFDGALTQTQAAKLFKDLKKQLDDRYSPLDNDQPLVHFDHGTDAGAKRGTHVCGGSKSVHADMMRLKAVAKLSTRVRQLDSHLVEHQQLIDHITASVCTLGSVVGLKLQPPSAVETCDAMHPGSRHALKGEE